MWTDTWQISEESWNSDGAPERSHFAGKRKTPGDFASDHEKHHASTRGRIVLPLIALFGTVLMGACWCESVVSTTSARPPAAPSRSATNSTSSSRTSQLGPRVSGQATRSVLVANLSNAAPGVADGKEQQPGTKPTKAKINSTSPQFNPKQLEFFESKIRPVLVDKCHRCHAGQQHKGGLRLDSRESILRGGDSGAAIVLGDPAKSLLIEAVRFEGGREMPPNGKLTERVVADLVQWVQIGAPWPTEKSTRSTNANVAFEITAQDRAHWAYQPIARPVVPAVRTANVHGANWTAHPIDAFILARLEAQQLTPNRPASRRELIRRATFDLIGLPPTAREVAEFESDNSTNAYEKLIDRLLARPEYGERWGRHWLDVVRFAQTNGYERDGEKPQSWRYRDYVIKSFQEDKPYNQFIVEQLAGDEVDQLTHDSITATGFYRLGVWDDEPDDRKQAEFDELDEIIRTTGSAFLGTTIGCARCHNHMFDPIPQHDYYAFLAFFRNITLYGQGASATHSRFNMEGNYTPLFDQASFDKWNQQRAKNETGIRELKKKIAVLGPGGDRDAERKKLNAELKQLEAEVGKSYPNSALSVREPGKEVRQTTHVLVRGNASTPLAPSIAPRFPEIFGGHLTAPKIIPADQFAVSTGNGSSAGGKTSPNDSLDRGENVRKPSGSSYRKLLREAGVPETSGRRRALAEWIASPSNPLTARVMVNRIWQHHFGRGLVATPDNFGKAGLPPTHPQLLDWLAAEFIAGGWSIKRMHKQILLSNAYQMSSRATNEDAARRDPGNDLFWRQNLVRLDAEVIRDAILAVSGELNLKRGGRGIFPTLSQDVLDTQSSPGNGWENNTPQAEQNRRSVYIFIKRTLMVPMLETFDYATTAESMGARPITTVAPQALMLLNSRFMQQQSQHLAARVRREAGDKPVDQVRRLFELALQRPPTTREETIGLGFLTTGKTSPPIAPPSGEKKSGGTDPAESAEARLAALCLVVLNLNEFVYID